MRYFMHEWPYRFGSIFFSTKPLKCWSVIAPKYVKAVTRQNNWVVFRSNISLDDRMSKKRLASIILPQRATSGTFVLDLLFTNTMSLQKNEQEFKKSFHFKIVNQVTFNFSKILDQIELVIRITLMFSFNGSSHLRWW